MQTMITIQGGSQPSITAPWNFQTNQGVFKVWPTEGDDPNPIVDMFRHGINQTFLVEYTEKPWTNKYNKTVQQKYVDSAEPATGDETNIPSTDTNRAQNVAQVSPVDAEPPQLQNHPQIASAPMGASAPDIRTETAAMIFVTGVVGRAMGSGKFEASEIVSLTAIALDAWHSIPKEEYTRTNPPLYSDPLQQADGEPMAEER